MKPIRYIITEGVNTINQACYIMKLKDRKILCFPKMSFNRDEVESEVTEFIETQKEIDKNENITFTWKIQY